MSQPSEPIERPDPAEQDQPSPRALTQAQRQAVAELVRVAPVVGRLTDRFATAGHELALVGGSVRDALLGRLGVDLDFATSARPEQVQALLDGWAEALWDVGIAYGTVAALKDGYRLEITTYRSEAYDPQSRKPAVAYGDTLDGDLHRRDFTVNAMALTLPEQVFVDPYGGLPDLVAGRLRTPATPEESFSDDPLRMLRAARFAAQLGFAVDPEVRSAMTRMADRIAIVSAERVQGEVVKLVEADRPVAGLRLLVDTGLAEQVLPELPLLRLEIDEHHRHKDVYEHTLTVLEQSMELEGAPDGPLSRPDFVLRFAALMHDVGKPKTRAFEPGGGVSFHHHEVVGAKITRRRMQALRFGNEVTDEVCSLVALHLRFHGFGEGGWTDSAVRRFVRDAGGQLDRLLALTRADCTTRNRRRAELLQGQVDELEERIARLRAQEELDAIRPDLDGAAIMALLGIPPGPTVGQAYRFLLERRLDRGPVDAATAAAELLAWWSDRPGSGGSDGPATATSS
ncbi:MAG: CCA tRNA nucleotidyltransferase [Actinomycetes bacterium]